MSIKRYVPVFIRFRSARYEDVVIRLVAGGISCRLKAMNDVTSILATIERGDPSVAGQLLPLIYDELRKLAAQKLAHEQPGHTLQARLVELRYFAGLTGEEAAKILGISARTADRYWVYTRAWLRREMEAAGPKEKIEKNPGAGDAVSSH